MNKQDFQVFVEHCEVVCSLPNDKTVLKVKPNGDKIIMKGVKMPKISKCFLKQMEQTLQQQKELHHDHLLPVIDYHFRNSEEFIIFTEFHRHSLREEFFYRRKKYHPFSTEELQNILLSVVRVLKYLENNAIGHGCISLDDIFIAENGFIKLIDPSMASNSPFNFKQSYYYSPQLFTNSESVDFFKNDIFVLGMNLLQLGLLRPMKICYNYPQLIINEKVVNDYLLEFQEKYGKRFGNLLSHMLNFEAQMRLRLDDILHNVEKWFNYSETDESFSFEYPDINLRQIEESKNVTVDSFLLDGKASCYESNLNSKAEDDVLLISNPLNRHVNKQNMKILRNI